MFESLIDQIPSTVAIGLLVFMVCYNFFFGLGRLIYMYITKNDEKTIIDKLETKVEKISEDLKKELKELNREAMNKVEEIEKTSNDASNQVAIMLAHYESEVRFRQMLENKVNSIEKQLQGNGKPSISTEIELLKQKLDVVSEDLKSINKKIK